MRFHHKWKQNPNSNQMSLIASISVSQHQSAFCCLHEPMHCFRDKFEGCVLPDCKEIDLTYQCLQEQSISAIITSVANMVPQVWLPFRPVFFFLIEIVYKI